MRGFLTHSYFSTYDDVLLNTINTVPEKLIDAVDFLSHEPEVIQFLSEAEAEASKLKSPMETDDEDDEPLFSPTPRLIK